MEKPWRSPRRHGRPNQQSSDDNGSDDEVNPQSKYAKKPPGKGRAFPPKKKAKTTKNTPVKDDSDDDYSSDDEETTFGMKSLGKKKGSPQKTKKTNDTKKRAIEESDEEDGNDDNDEEQTDIHEMRREDLIAKIKEQERKIRDLKMKLRNKKDTARRSLKNIRLDQDWNAEETIFAEAVGRYVKSFLFPRYKFLKIGWEEYRPDVKDSLSSVMEEAMKKKQPQKNKREMWERVSVYTIRLKYSNMKCNLNNVIKTAYKSKFCIYSTCVIC